MAELEKEVVEAIEGLDIVQMVDVPDRRSKEQILRDARSNISPVFVRDARLSNQAGLTARDYDIAKANATRKGLAINPSYVSIRKSDIETARKY